MADPRELSAPDLNRYIADVLDRALSSPGRPREPEGWRIQNVSAEPEGDGLWIVFGIKDDPDNFVEFRFEYVPNADGQQGSSTP